MKTIIKIPNQDKKYLDILKFKLIDKNINEKEKAYYERMLKLYNLADLSKQVGNPVEMLISKIIYSDYYKDFSILDIPEIVSEYETFDLFNFPKDHVARRKSDSYFINKSGISKESILLRPHTSVMWYHYLINGGKEILEKSGEIKALSYGKVYRVDELDKSHHECFHQIDGLHVCDKEIKVISQETLKEVLSNTIKSIFGEDVVYRFNKDYFPYTVESLEVEVNIDGRWLEVLGAGVVNSEVLERLGIDSKKYNGWAFGFGIERLAMLLKQIPDIRILWSDDKRIKKQWGNFEAYKEVSNYPPVYKDISFIVDKSLFIRDLEEEKKSGEIELTKKSEKDLFELSSLIRDISGDLIEEVKIIDIYEDDNKFSKDKKSVTIKITFRSIERTLIDEEINKLYFEIRGKIEKELCYELR